MAVTQSRDNRTLIAAADLSGSQHLFAAMDAAGKAALCGDGAQAFGVIEVGGTAAAASTITVSGKVMVKCGGTVTIGDDVSSDAAGKAVNSASGDIILGRAYEAGATDQLIAIELGSTGNAHA
tara:strand:- start:257 stop:625 length:369 start_codon:yes stop_codon:yes gene_type:complete